MKLGKKLIACALVVVCIVALCACVPGEQTDTPADEETESEPTTDPEESATEESAEPDPDSIPRASAVPAKITIVPETVVDTDGVQISLSGLEEDDRSYFMKLTITNANDYDVVLTTKDEVINGYVIGGGLWAGVPAGSNASAAIEFSKTKLAECGIDTMAKIELRFWAMAVEKLDTLFITESILIPTSAFDEGYQQTYDDSGVELVTDSGIRIVTKKLTTNEWTGEPKLVFYAENTSNMNLALLCKRVTVNGYEITATNNLYNLLPHTRAIVETTLSAAEMEEFEVSVDDVKEISFQILDGNTLNELSETDMVQIELNN